METQITMSGPTNYHPNYPPRDARKGYVAKITGRAPGAKKYEREFLGKSAVVLEGDEGLYERQVGKKNGGYTRYYHVVLSHPEHGLICSVDCEAIVPRIAKLLSDGHAIEEIVDILDLRPSQKHEGRMIFTAAVRSASQAKSAKAAATIDEAVATCAAALSGLEPAAQRKVLAALRKQLTTPSPAR